MNCCQPEQSIAQTVYWFMELTHWGRVTHICISNLTIIGSDNGLSPGRCQAIIWTNAGILLIGPLGTHLSEILIGNSYIFIQENVFENVVCQMAVILSIQFISVNKHCSNVTWASGVSQITSKSNVQWLVKAKNKKENIKAPHYRHFSQENSLVTGEIPSQGSGNTESFSMPCCHHARDNRHGNLVQIWLTIASPMLIVLYDIAGLILGLHPANERCRYKVPPSLIGWAQNLESAMNWPRLPEYTSSGKGKGVCILTHWGWDKMATNFLTTFSNVFSWMKMYEFRLRFH